MRKIILKNLELLKKVIVKEGLFGMKEKSTKNLPLTFMKISLIFIIACTFFINGCSTTGSSSGAVISGNSNYIAAETKQPQIILMGVGDSYENPVDSITLDYNSKKEIEIVIEGGKGNYKNTPQITAKTNRSDLVNIDFNDNKLKITVKDSGRATLFLEAPSLGIARNLVLKIKDIGGNLTDLPNYIAIGSIDRDFNTNQTLWQNAAVNLRYIYLQGGFGDRGWYNSYPGLGGYLTNFITNSYTVSMIPVFVYYQMPGDQPDSAAIDYANVNSTVYMKQYYHDYVTALELMNASKDKFFSVMILEPDFLGYMLQNYSASNTKGPEEIAAAGVAGVYEVTDSSGNPIAVEGDIPGVPAGEANNIRAYVYTMNYLAHKYSPTTKFGWKLNIWCTSWPGNVLPAKGIAHITDACTTLAEFTTQRNTLKQNSTWAANFFLNAGVKGLDGARYPTHLFFDRYGIDGGAIPPYTTNQDYGWDSPQDSSWFWNLPMCNNYILFVKTAYDIIKLPVGLWQIPMGHINSSQTTNALSCLPIDLGSFFPDLIDGADLNAAELLETMGSNWKGDNYGWWEDTMPTYIFGDTFKITTACGGNKKLKNGLTPVQVANRKTYFSKADPEDPNGLTASGDNITYSRHTSNLKDAGVVMILFGPGVGTASTNGTGWNNLSDPTWGNKTPVDWFWWTNKAQDYLKNHKEMLDN